MILGKWLGIEQKDVEQGKKGLQNIVDTLTNIFTKLNSKNENVSVETAKNTAETVKSVKANFLSAESYNVKRKAIKDATIAKIEHTGATNAATIGTASQSVANTGLAASFEALWISMKPVLAALAANPLTWILGVGALAVVLEDLFTVDYDEANKALEESSKKLNEEKETLDSLNKELDDSKARLDELSKLKNDGSITEVEQEELDKLTLQNEQLERKIALQKELVELTKKNTIDDANVAITKASHSVAQSVETGDSTGKSNAKGIVGKVTDSEAIKEDLELIKKYENEVTELEEELIESKSRVAYYESLGSNGVFKAIAESTVKDTEMKIQHRKDSLETLYSDLETRSANIEKNLDVLKLDPTGNAEKIKELESSLALVNQELVNTKEKLDDINSTEKELSTKKDESILNKNINDSYDTIKKSHDALQEYKKAMSSGMTESALDGVADLSSELKVMVAGYHAGTVSANELYDALQEHYDNDLKNYAKALIEKNEYSESFYNAVGLSDSDFVNHMSKNYDVDLKNCKNYAEAKERIEAQCLANISGIWGDYYNVQSKTYTSQVDSLRNELKLLEQSGKKGVDVDEDIAYLKSLLKQVEKNVSVYENAMSELEKNTYEGIVSNFDGISSTLDKNSSSGSKTEEVIDHIATKIERLEREIESLGKTASATYKTWEERNNALSKQISKTTEEIALQEEALAYYKKKANEVGLSKEYQDLVKYGGIQVDTITDEKLAEKIQKYQEWYDKILACEDSVEDLNAELSSLARQKFDNVVQQYNDELSAIEHEANVIDALIENAENRGQIVSSEYYNKLIEQEKKNKLLLEKEYSDLRDELAKAMSTGNIVEGSEEWHSMCQEINGVQEAIIESDNALIQYLNDIRQLKWDAFDRLQEKISNITEETEFLISLMEDSELYDDKGQLTDTGMSTMGLHAQSYNVLMAQADKYAEEVERINSDLANDPNNQELLDRKQELIELQRESILAANDEKQAILDMVEEGINLELEALQEKIDLYKEAQQNAKDLYDYQKNIEDQVKNIASLEKQMAAYKGDTSEENISKIQQIKVQLEEAKADLEETEMEHALSETEKLLDNLYTEYEEILNERLDNIDVLLQDMINEVNNNASTISETLEREASNVGYTITESMKNIWSNEGEANSIITKYGEDFCSQLTSVNSVLNAIAEHMGAIIKESDNDANNAIDNVQDKPVTTPITPTTPTEESKKEDTSKTEESKNESTKVISVGGKINAGSAKIYDYAGDKSGETQYYKNDPIYTVLEEKNGYLKVRHHKLSSGVSGWFKKTDVKAYKTGGLADETGFAWLDGTKSKPEMVLNARDTENFMDLTKTLRKATAEDSVLFNSDWINNVDNLISCMQPMFDSLSGNVQRFIPNVASQNMSNVFNMNFELHEVQNGRDVVNFLIKDPTFENAVKAMTVDRLAGGSKFSKSKYYKNN